ncbi:unnamed protein product, partial [Leptidea sinapis]
VEVGYFSHVAESRLGSRRPIGSHYCGGLTEARARGKGAIEASSTRRIAVQVRSISRVCVCRKQVIRSKTEDVWKLLKNDGHEEWWRRELWTSLSSWQVYEEGLCMCWNIWRPSP